MPVPIVTENHLYPRFNKNVLPAERIQDLRRGEIANDPPPAHIMFCGLELS